MKTFASLALVPFLGLTACATGPELPAVPAQLNPPAGERLALVTRAAGVQIYECRARKDASSQFEWAFVAPEAQLADTGGKPVGKHYAGPRWEAMDGSKVLGSVEQRAEAPQAGAIPWLLLGIRSDGPEGVFARFSHVQRVNTSGGVAPTAGCDASALGRQARVAYTSDYLFFAR